VALAGSRLADFAVHRKIGGKDVTPGAMAMTLTMHGVCSYVYTVTSRRPTASVAGELALKVQPSKDPNAQRTLEAIERVEDLCAETLLKLGVTRNDGARVFIA
jgi:hypothetical protein